jgi:hypothetical protein
MKFKVTETTMKTNVENVFDRVSIDNKMHQSTIFRIDGHMDDDFHHAIVSPTSGRYDHVFVTFFDSKENRLAEPVILAKVNGKWEIVVVVEGLNQFCPILDGIERSVSIESSDGYL